MAQEHFDVLFLGGGSGGYVGAIRAAQLGLKAAIVESDKIGGTCLHRGCIPTKTLLQSAHLLTMFRRGSDFGVKADNISYDYALVNSRKERIVSQLHRGVEFLLSKHRVALLKGRGRIIDPNNVHIDQNGEGRLQLQANNIVIATGSRVRKLPGIDFDGELIINSDHALALGKVPKSILIIGAGAIGTEFAFIFNAFGCEVNLIESLSTILPNEDKEIGKEVADSLSKQGIRIHAGARVQLDSVRTNRNSVQLQIGMNGQSSTLEGEKLLIAIGREGVTDGLGLENINVVTDHSFVKVDGSLRTGEPNVFAIGDVVGGLLLAHKASAQGIFVAETIAGTNPRPLDYGNVPRITYCYPQVACVGLTEDEAGARGLRLKTGRFPLRANSMSLINGNTEGFVKIISDADSGEILGVHIVGENAADLIAEPEITRLLEGTTEEIGKNIHPHPTVGEAVAEAALDANGKAIHIWRG